MKKENMRRQERKAVVRRPRIGHHRKSHKNNKRKSKKKGQIVEAKTVGGMKAQTPREKRFQTRAKRTKNVKTSRDTPKATTAQIKEKAPSAKQSKTVKTVSTGRQKIATTGLSTGSLGKGQQKEKLAKILAREAAPVLATLSTSIPSTNTHFFQGSDTI